MPATFSSSLRLCAVLFPVVFLQACGGGGTTDADSSSAVSASPLMQLEQQAAQAEPAAQPEQVPAVPVVAVQVQAGTPVDTGSVPADVTGQPAGRILPVQVLLAQQKPGRVLEGTVGSSPERVVEGVVKPSSERAQDGGGVSQSERVVEGVVAPSSERVLGSMVTPAPERVVEGVVTPAPAAATRVPGFRLSREEMLDIANPGKLGRRVFYERPSQGPDARWFDAVKRGDAATVRQMVAEGQNLEARDEAELGQTALGWAAFIGYEDITDFLIDEGADLHATDRGDVYNVLKSAVLGKNTRIVRKLHDLLRASTDLNDQTVEGDGETLLMVAASNNRLDTARYLIEQGANVNLVATTTDRSLGAYDQGALSYACDRNHPDMQRLLIASGAVNHRTGKPAC